MKEQIDELIKRYLEIVNSPRNEQNKKLWSRTDGWNRDMWRGTPRRAADSSAVPFTIAPDNSLWAKILKLDLRDYYTDPYVYLKAQLEQRIFSYENFTDNTVYTDELFIWFGVVTELSMFGADIVLLPQKEPWIQGTVISDYDIVESLEYPDFYKSGLMPRIHEYYKVFQELSRGRLKVMFPDFVRGPFCIASHLRGFQNMLMDTLTDEDGVTSLLRYIVDSSKNWRAEREKFTGEKNNKCRLYNDEIECPMMSPKTYEDLILPFEMELADYYGGVSYWHSCGNTTLLLPLVKKLRGLELMHIGPWTDYALATQLFSGTETALDICLNSQSAVLEVDEAGMLSKLEDILEKCNGMNYSIRADVFMPTPNTDEVEKIRQWSALAVRTLGGNA